MLFNKITIRGTDFKNRIFVSPMCQYSAENGFANDWHLVHLGTRAVGGASLVIFEATAVSPEGRISPDDLGIWNDEQIQSLIKITDFIRSQNSKSGIQLAHAGRKASTYAPWKGSGKVEIENGGWNVIAPSSSAFHESFHTPKQLTSEEINILIKNFQVAAKRSIDAGFDVIEIHAAHGYLIHQFLSPLSNFRSDLYGGSFENRIRFVKNICSSVRKVIPDSMPLFMRISATDYTKGGWDLEQSIELVKILKHEGVDFIDCSSGGILPGIKIPIEKNYQIPFSEQIKHKANILTGGVGLINEAIQADKIIREGKADAVLLGRELLRNPYFPIEAAKSLNIPIDISSQYLRAY